MKTPEKYRLKDGPLRSDESFGNNGVFIIPFENNVLSVIASDGQCWEHVSVSLGDRVPNWKEMCFIKNLFWNDDECVVQYHPSKDVYINNHNYCLHLWKPLCEKLPIPPSILVGMKEFNNN